MRQLEPLWYEISPFVYLILGLGTIVLANYLGVAFGVLLMTMALAILTLRWNYRSNQHSAPHPSPAPKTLTLPRRNTVNRGH